MILNSLLGALKPGKLESILGWMVVSTIGEFPQLFWVCLLRTYRSAADRDRQARENGLGDFNFISWVFKSVRSTVIRSSCFPLFFFFFLHFFSQQRGLKIEFINSLWWCFAPSVKLILLFMFLCFLPLYNWEDLFMSWVVGLFLFCDWDRFWIWRWTNWLWISEQCRTIL